MSIRIFGARPFEEDEHGSVEVTVVGIGGDPVTKVMAGPRDTVLKVKRAVQQECGFPLQAQKLLHQEAVLEDVVSLSSLPTPLMFTLVLLGFDAFEALESAFQFGRETAAKALLTRMQSGEEEHTLPTLLRNGRGLNFFFYAAIRGHETLCQLLLDAAPSLAVRGRMVMQGSHNPLVIAAENGHEGICRLLLHADLGPGVLENMLAPTDGHYVETGNALIHAAEDGHESICRLLLGAAPSVEVLEEMLATCGADTPMALESAVSGGHESVCRLFLGEALFPEVLGRMVVSGDAHSPWAMDDDERIHDLACDAAPNLEEGGKMLDPPEENTENTSDLAVTISHEIRSRTCTPLSLKGCLHLAVENGHEAICQLLFEAIPSPEARDGMLTTACSGNALHSASLDCPLRSAVLQGHEDVCRLLLNTASCPEVLSKMLVAGRGDSLCWAVMYGHESICQLLLDAAPSSEDRSKMLEWSESLPKHYWVSAIKNGHEKICRLLLDAGPSEELRSELAEILQA